MDKVDLYMKSEIRSMDNSKQVILCLFRFNIIYEKLITSQMDVIFFPKLVEFNYILFKNCKNSNVLDFASVVT